MAVDACSTNVSICSTCLQVSGRRVQLFAPRRIVSFGCIKNPQKVSGSDQKPSSLAALTNRLASKSGMAKSVSLVPKLNFVETALKKVNDPVLLFVGSMK